MALALGVRVLYLVEQPSFPSFHKPETDALYYDQAARAIAAGDWSLGREPLRMSPGYFYFLGCIYRVAGPGPWAPRLVQIALGLCLVWLVWDTSRRLLGSRWALLPATAAAFYGPFIYFEGHLLADSLGAFLHVLVMWLAIRALQAPAQVGRWLVVGVAWGLCCVTRPNALPLLVPLGYAAWSGSGPALRERARILVALTLGGALAIAPVTLRNLFASGEPVLLTSHGGINLFVGNGPGATGTWRMPREVPGAWSPMEQFHLFHEAAEQALGRKLSGRAADDYWVGRTLDAITADPTAWLRLMLRKLHLYWNGRELHNVYDYEFTREVSLILGPPFVEFVFVAPFALVGMLLLLGRPGVGRFLGLYAATICGAIVLVYVTDRYRLPVVGPVLVIGAAFVRELVAYVRAANWRAFTGWFALWICACLIAVPVKVNKRFEEKYHHLGEAYLQLGQFDFAEWALLHSLRYDRGFLPSHRDLAVLYERTGRFDSAMGVLREVEGLANARGDTAAAGVAVTSRARLAAKGQAAAASAGPTAPAVRP